MSLTSEVQVRFDEIVTPGNLKWSTTSISVSAEERLSSAKGDLVKDTEIRSSFIFFFYIQSHVVTASPFIVFINSVLE